jgi:hypothetical protein
MNRKIVLKWELFGILVISLLGSVLHFVFDWSGQSAPVGAIAAVNESVWEHLKIAYWPTLIYAIIEYRFIKKYTNNYYFSKTACIFIIPIAIIGIFYTYTSILGYEILAVDILTFIFAIAIGQLIGYRILMARELPVYLDRVGFVFVILYGVCFVIFTYHTPNLPIFEDHATRLFLTI